MVAPKILHHEFNAIVEGPTEDDRWWVAYCPEVPGANGQGETEAEALEDLVHAIELILETNIEDRMKAVPASAKTVTVKLG